MIQPKPYKVVCKKCGWSKVITPKSDALSPSDFVFECPKCKGGNLEKEKMNPFNVVDMIKNIWGSK